MMCLKSRTVSEFMLGYDLLLEFLFKLNFKSPKSANKPPPPLNEKIRSVVFDGFP